MNYKCHELKGAIYQPERVLKLDDILIFPATENKSVLEIHDSKLICVIPENINNNLVGFFVFTYQFIFSKSYIYYLYSIPNEPNIFFESTSCVAEIERIINEKFQSGGPLKIDFEKIDSFHSNISEDLDFKVIFNRLIEKYNEDNKFRDIIDLYLYTAGSHNKLYDNLFQKIAQLQTIFESIIGKPEEERKCCGFNHYKETWRSFIDRRIKEIGITDEKFIELTIKIKSELNSARIKYVHDSQQYNTWKETIKEMQSGSSNNGDSSYTTKIQDILNNTLKVKDWRSLDWQNVYLFYQLIIKQLIYFEFLKS